MIRTLLATTAIVSMIATGALAQDTQTPDAPDTSTPQQAQPATPSNMKTGDEVKASPADTDGGHLATQLMGKTVYNGEGQNAQNIGSVKDMIIGDGGEIRSLVVGVGGFLGIGEKNVAIDYSQVKWEQQNGAWTVVVPTTADQLKTLPDFDRTAYQAAPVAGTGTESGDNTAPATGGMAATGTGAATPGMAPATGDTADTTNRTGAIDKDALKKVDVDTISANDLIGTAVYGPDNADLGSIDDVVLTKESKIDAVIVDVGGFLGIGSKKVAVGMDNLQFLADNDGKKYLYTSFTKDQLQSQPAYDKETYAANRDKMRMTVQ